jgi:hypothetical protein
MQIIFEINEEPIDSGTIFGTGTSGNWINFVKAL